ncbi:hypothetical protein AGDE_15656 [Angomonas deanei]|uniref:TbRIF5 SNase domain 1/TbRIF5 SNase domain 2, putative n=1 Tax=Angomonas deanei TaxID=59799 RepID=A0A7G2CFW2_9TRYP|nr:hypothetical protein AGDE_15656 [Angomonas deanei]CAD2217851.1 TbRIF5 SNase domain 1/TbRIF5 SNase domain 2, putative [Angomonas deanei]|eukprot:EPY18705.1 hypothetical protein AGDE_15656 [Angomonas deanei]
MPADRVDRDHALVRVTSVEWVAKNVFLVSVPVYQQKISCELAAVDVPRELGGVSSLVSHAVTLVNASTRVYLRQDYYSNFPYEGFGDVIFLNNPHLDAPTQEQWLSLQEVLLRLGVAKITRPTLIRFHHLLDSERCTAHRQCNWIEKQIQLEESPPFNKACRCTVLDVVRGDVFFVKWISEKSDKLPRVIILDSVTCLREDTEPGFRSLRWSQKRLIGKDLNVTIHSIYPSDKNLANNNQTVLYEQLEHCRVSATYVAGHTNEPVDLEGELLTGGLGVIRAPQDASVPRSTNFVKLIELLNNDFEQKAERRIRFPSQR